jgi:integrase
MASVDPWKLNANGKVTAWRARWRTPDGRSRSKVFERKRDADAHVAGIEAAKHRGIYVDPAGGRKRFGELAEEWAAVQDWKISTRQGWGQTRKRLVSIWNLPLAEVDRLTLERLRVELAEHYSRRATGDTMLRALAILRYAYANGLVGRDPTRGVDAAPKRRANDTPEHVSPDQVPTRAEALAILTNAPLAYRAAVALGLAGLRVGEVSAMSAERVAIDRREVTIDQQAQEITGQGMTLTTPKAERVRTIKVPGVVAVELRRHLRDHPSGPLFPGSSNGMMRRRAFYDRVWYPALKGAGLEGRFVFHALRHFAASTLLAEGAPITAVAGHLGDTVQTVTQTYAHWLRDDRDVPADVLDRVLAPDSGVTSVSRVSGDDTP